MLIGINKRWSQKLIGLKIDTQIHLNEMLIETDKKWS